MVFMEKKELTLEELATLFIDGKLTKEELDERVFSGNYSKTKEETETNVSFSGNYSIDSSEESYIRAINEDGETIGYVEYSLEEGDLGNIFNVNFIEIFGKNKRNGLGTALLNEAQEKALKLGAKVLNCQVRKENKSAIKFVEKNGAQLDLTKKDSVFNHYTAQLYF